LPRTLEEKRILEAVVLVAVIVIIDAVTIQVEDVDIKDVCINDEVLVHLTNVWLHGRRPTIVATKQNMIRVVITVMRKLG
jgi:hypothetical protein